MTLRLILLALLVLASPAFAQDPVTIPGGSAGGMPPQLMQALSGMMGGQQPPSAAQPAAPPALDGDNTVAQALMGMLAPQDTSNLQGLLAPAGQPAAAAAVPAPVNAAASGQADLSIGAWLLRPELSTQLTGQLPPALQQLGAAARFKHMFFAVTIPSGQLQLHGLNIGGTLQIRCGSASASDAWRTAHNDTALGFMPVALPASLPPLQALGRILDFAVAVNGGRLPYQMASAGAPPLNSNAAAAGMAEAIGICRAGACDGLDQLFPGSYAPGVNAGLTARLSLGDEFLRQATAGAAAGVLLNAFCRVYPLPAGAPITPSL